MDTRTKLSVVAFLTVFSTSTATAIEESQQSLYSNSEVVYSKNYYGTNTFVIQDEVKIEKRKRNYRERYRRIAKSSWFNQHYNNRSLGVVEDIVD